MRKLIVAIVWVLAISCLAFILISQMFPYMLKPISIIAGIPYTVESVSVEYTDTGATMFRAYTTSYQRNGGEIVLSHSFPGHPLETAFRRLLDTTGLVLGAIVRTFSVNAGGSSFVTSGCVGGQDEIVGRETILEYPTVVRQIDFPQQRVKLWVAPDLGCFALKMTIEERRPDGSFSLRGERKALKVNVRSAS